MQTMPLAPIRVHLVSSRTLVRSGLSALLRGQPQMQVVGESPTLPNTAPADLVLWDAHDTNPHSLPVPFLVLLSDSRSARAWLDAGANGIVLESSPIEQLLDAIRQAARGETYLPPELAPQVIASLGTSAPPRDSLVEPLTDREREVLQLLAQGLSNKDIADTLCISIRTVHGHLNSIFHKLKVGSRTEAIFQSVKRELLTFEDLA